MDMEGAGDVGWTCRACTFPNVGSSLVCAMCSTDRVDLLHRNTFASRALRSLAGDGIISFPAISICSVPRMLAGALSGALTGMFAVVGAFTGAVTGALAGRATDSGWLRGAGLGAVAGAVLSVEVLEASRSYWQSGRAGSVGESSSVVEFIDDLLNGRFSQEQTSSRIFSMTGWQSNISDMSYEDLYEMFGPLDVVTKGISKAQLKMLPWYTITRDNKNDFLGENACSICLQEFLYGDTARKLPYCHHVFHMACVDEWLLRQGSCPVCRQRFEDRF